MSRYKLSNYTLIVKPSKNSENRIIVSGRTGFLTIISNQEFLQVKSRLEQGQLLTGDQKWVSAGYFIQEDFLSKEQEEVHRIVNRRIENSKFDSKVFLLTLTMKCNLECPYCFESDSNKVMSEKILDASLELINRTMLNSKKPVVVNFFGGEPLLKPDLIEKTTFELRDFAKTEKIANPKIGIITNGSFFPKRLETLFLEEKVDAVNIILDGLADQHDIRRPTKMAKTSSFERIWRNLPRFVNIAKKLHIRINIDRENWNSIPLLIKKLKRFEFSDKMVLDFQPIENIGGRGIDYPFCLSGEEWAEIYSILQLEFSQDCFVSLSNEPLQIKPTFCRAMEERKITIGTNGDIYLCERALDDSNYVIGNVLTDYSFSHPNANIWKWNADHRKECLTCKYLLFCGGGCTWHQLYDGRCPPIKYQFDNLAIAAAIRTKNSFRKNIFRTSTQ